MLILTHFEVLILTPAQRIFPNANMRQIFPNPGPIFFWVRAGSRSWPQVLILTENVLILTENVLILTPGWNDAKARRSALPLSDPYHFFPAFSICYVFAIFVSFLWESCRNVNINTSDIWSCQKYIKSFKMSSIIHRSVNINTSGVNINISLSI